MNTNSTAINYAPQSAPAATAPLAKGYILGHHEEELKRLEAQGAFLAPSTRDFLERVGITKGMRVLDIGCGAGDVSFIAADLVGVSGEIIGVDRVEAAVDVANLRAQAKGVTNARFVQCDIANLDDLAAHGQFDAVICRLVMVHQKNPAEAIKKLLRLVRPGGVVGFQEVDMDQRYWSTHKMDILEELWDAVDSVVARGGMTKNLGAAFTQAFDEAGIVQRRIIRTGAIESAGDNSGVYEWLGGFARTLSKAMAAMGLEEPGFAQTFTQRLRSEAASTGAAFIPAHFIGAAGRLPYLRSVES